MIRRESPATKDRATRATPIATRQSTANRVDKHLTAAGGDESLWAAIFNGSFRLAVQCDVCGRWLTAATSKKSRRGPVCRAKAVDR